MGEKLKDLCKACNTILGDADPQKPMPTKCPNCGKERMAREIVFTEETNDVEYDLFITNKRTAVAQHFGFVLRAETLVGKTERQKRIELVAQSAEALRSLLSPENVGKLMERP